MFSKRRVAVFPLVVLILSLLTACSLLNSPPVASFSAFPNSGSAPLVVSFDASSSSDTDGIIVSYCWVFGDGTTGSGKVKTHTYELPGVYTATLTVTDNHGAEESASQAIQVAQAAITASFVANPTSGESPLSVDFDASGSFDPGGESITYAWSFGDGSTGVGVVARHTYYTAGIYAVLLTVRNESGDEDQATATIAVSEAPTPGNVMPNAAFTCTPNTGEAPLLVSFNATGSSDSDGHITSCQWTFGDGEHGSGTTTSHTYTDSGTYEVWLMVADNNGATDTATRTIQAVAAPTANTPPTASFTASPTSGGAPLAVSFSASGSSDSDGTISSYAWAFGDGEHASGVTTTHVYSNPGSYTTTLTVTDDDGSSDSESNNIAVTSSVGIVNFPDPGLEVAIRDAIGKPTGDIYRSDLVDLDFLNAGNLSIADLEGIQYCMDLEVLTLSRNRISDLSALAGLSGLITLALGGNQISDISALYGLAALRWLWLDNNQIVNITALSSLTNLAFLYLEHNQISDISSLSTLVNLSDLVLSFNQIVNISALSALTALSYLQVGENQISDIGVLASLISLTVLGLSNNQISNIGVLGGLTNLEALGLSNNQISNIGVLSSLYRLETLGLAYNQIVDISALSGLTNLDWLHLSNNQIVDLAALVNNPGIAFGDSVYVQENQLILAPGSQDMLDIQALETRGVNVSF